MKWWRTSLDLAPKRCLSSIKPFISIRSAANNQREVPRFLAETGALFFLRISTNVLSFWNQQELEKRAVPDITSCCADSSLCSPGPPPLPQTPYSNKAHGTGHLCGNNRPLNHVWTRLFGLRGMCLKPLSLQDAAFDGFDLVERNNVCLSDDLVLRH